MLSHCLHEQPSHRGSFHTENTNVGEDSRVDVEPHSANIQTRRAHIRSYWLRLTLEEILPSTLAPTITAAVMSRRAPRLLKLHKSLTETQGGSIFHQYQPLKQSVNIIHATTEHTSNRFFSPAGSEKPAASQRSRHTGRAADRDKAAQPADELPVRRQRHHESDPTSRSFRCTAPMGSFTTEKIEEC